MTTAIKTKKEENATITIIDGQEVRGHIHNKRKYYYLSDLKNLYGKKFMSYMEESPLSKRVPYRGNSQMRQLINVLVFREAFKKYKEANQAKKKGSTKADKPSKALTKKHIAAQLDMCFETKSQYGKVYAKPCEPVAPAMMIKTLGRAALTDEIPMEHPHIPIVAKDDTSDIVKRRWKSMRGEIARVMREHAVATYGHTEMTKDEQLKLWDVHYLEYYTNAYKAFDKKLCEAFNVNLPTLMRMGYVATDNNYVDVIQGKGQLEEFRTVVYELYGKSNQE
jgi:hypothetical protein